MTDHDPRAADIIAHGFDPDEPEWDYVGNIDREDEWYTTPRELATTALDALAAAGLVVRPADEYEQVEWGWSDEWPPRPVIDDDDGCDGWPEDPSDRPLYVRKENPDD